MKIKIVVISMVFMMMCGSFSVSANIDIKDIEANSELTTNITTHDALKYWERYPYCPLGTDITFPLDEGVHNPEVFYPNEWWYANFLVTGKSTGSEYGVFVSFFKHPQMLLFSISDLNQKKSYTDSKFGTFRGAEGALDLTFSTLFDKDYWYTKQTEDGELIPFQYRIEVDGKDREYNNQKMEINVDMHCLKPPLIASGDGIVEIGTGGSYYYCQTKIEVTGDITVHGITEEITGFGWIDHQWRNLFMCQSSGRFAWEWFSIKLNDNSEILVGDVFWMHSKEYYGGYTDGLNLFNANNKLELYEDYTITQLDFWTDPVTERKFSTKWRLTEPSKPIDLTINAEFENQMMHIVTNPTLIELILKIFPFTLFWEGFCTVSGTIGDKQVSGDAYVELTHSWEDRGGTENIQEISEGN